MFCFLKVWLLIEQRLGMSAVPKASECEMSQREGFYCFKCYLYFLCTKWINMSWTLNWNNHYKEGFNWFIKEWSKKKKLWAIISRNWHASQKPYYILKDLNILKSFTLNPCLFRAAAIRVGDNNDEMHIIGKPARKIILKSSSKVFHLQNIPINQTKPPHHLRKVFA